jgi:hypothetical protein
MQHSFVKVGHQIIDLIIQSTFVVKTKEKAKYANNSHHIQTA